MTDSGGGNPRYQTWMPAYAGMTGGGGAGMAGEICEGLTGEVCAGMTERALREYDPVKG